eukprot:3061541-Prymnesium_polylepis.1
MKSTSGVIPIRHWKGGGMCSTSKQCSESEGTWKGGARVRGGLGSKTSLTVLAHHRHFLRQPFPVALPQQ